MAELVVLEASTPLKSVELGSSRVHDFKCRTTEPCSAVVGEVAMARAQVFAGAAIAIPQAVVLALPVRASTVQAEHGTRSNFKLQDRRGMLVGTAHAPPQATPVTVAAGFRLDTVGEVVISVSLVKPEEAPTGAAVTTPQAGSVEAMARARATAWTATPTCLGS